MVNYWIFVSVPFSDFNVSTIIEMFNNKEKVFKWRIGKKTPHREKLSEGDKIIFYQGGENGGNIVASAVLISNLQNGDFDDFVNMNNLEIWSKSVDIRTLIDKLSFIKNKKYWGLHFQGGIIKIPDVDYNKIIKKSKKLNKTNKLI